jgi:hypothetical protein
LGLLVLLVQYHLLTLLHLSGLSLQQGQLIQLGLSVHQHQLGLSDLLDLYYQSGLYFLLGRVALLLCYLHP